MEFRVLVQSVFPRASAPSVWPLARTSGRTQTAVLGSLLVLFAAPTPAGAQAGGDADLKLLVGALESPDLALREAAMKSLGAAGHAGASAALFEFSGAALRSRAARSEVVRQHADRASLTAVLALCPDPSPEVREDFAVYLGRVLRVQPGASAEEIDLACAQLARFAASDPQSTVRTEALEALARANLDATAGTLSELTCALPGAEGAMAARALSNSPRAGRLLMELVQRSFEVPDKALDEPALAMLLGEGYGPALAEEDAGGMDPRSRLPFIRAERSTSPVLRAAGQLAFQGFLSRARFLGASGRAERVAALLAGELVNPGPVLLASATYSLAAGSDPARALEALWRLRALLGPPRAEDAQGRFDLAVAETLTAAAQLAGGRRELAETALEAARCLLAGLAGEGLERAGSPGAALAAEVAAERAVVECYALLSLLRAGRAFDHDECQVIARSVHELSLRAQLLQTAGPLQSWTGDLDLLAHHAHGPFDLLLSNPEWSRGLGAHPLDLALGLGRALATAVPDEMPGFEVSDAGRELDESRLGLLLQIETSRLQQLQRELARLPAEAPERVELENALRVLSAVIDNEPDLHRVRLPSALSIELAGDLRDEGRPLEAAALMSRAKEALTRADFLFGGPYLQELIARAESTLGSCLTDQGQPEEADRILGAALARLETLAASGIDDGRSRSVRSSVLVSLAVNANVKLRDPAKALAYFERAFELRQDDFTRTLLACYRARAGRKDEARALLREMPESPFNYYNLACTRALIGDRELALDYLAREFRAGSKSAAAIERQRIWARTDPDLASLHGDEQFELLVGK